MSMVVLQINYDNTYFTKQEIITGVEEKMKEMSTPFSFGPEKEKQTPNVQEVNSED